MNKHLQFLRTSIVLLFLFLTVNLSAAVFPVSTLNDSGLGSLRQAMTLANAAGPGPHSITFLTSGTIDILSNLPVITVSNLTIDGNSNITIDGKGGNNARYIFRGNADADFLTIRNLDVKNIGYEPFRFDGSPTDITIENVDWYNETGNYINFGVNYVGNADGLNIIDVVAKDHENYGAIVEITGTANNVLIDNLTFDNTLSYHHSVEVVRIAGAASNISIQNCNWNLDNGLSTNDGDYGIYFYNTVTNCTIKNVSILNCEIYPLYARLAVTDMTISNFTTTNGDGYAGAYGMRFNSTVTNLDMDTIVLDLDHTTSTNDGNYGIYFANTATNISIDSLEIHDAEIYGIYIANKANNFSINNATIDNFDGGTTTQGIRFQSWAQNITLTDVIINGDVNGTTNDGDYGLLFINSVTDDIKLTRVTINEFDVDGFYAFDVDTIIVDECAFTNNYDGMEFYGNRNRDNNIIKNSVFDNNTRGGLVINVANAITEFEIDSNVFSNNQKGLWLYSTGGVKDIQVRNNTFSNNSQDGIYNEQADGVLYSQNLMWGNTEGIDNVANNGNNDLENADGDIPFLASSDDAGSGNFNLTFTLPAICNSGDCDVEFFTNLENDIYLNGRSYISTSTGLGSGSHTVLLNSGGNKEGFWTATLKVSSLNNSVSEFSDPLVIKPKFPAGVGEGIALWMKADLGVTEVGGNDITVWEDQTGNHTPSFYNSDPDLLDSGNDLVNFNPTVSFDGNDYIRWDGDDFVEGYTSGEVFMLGREASPVTTTHYHLFDFGCSATTPYYTFSNQLIYEAFGSTDRKRWNPNDVGVAGGEGATDATISGPNRSTTDYNVYNVFSETNNWQASFNGVTQVSDPTNITNFSQAGVPHIGGVYSNGGTTGTLPEIVLYNRVLDLDERQRVNSYLAIKYGITLGHNYYASDWNGTTGTTLWTIGGGYDSDIAGIARDDEGILWQKQSKSINTDVIVSIYNEDQSSAFPESNLLNTDTPTVDMSSMVWGNNGNNTSYALAYAPNSFIPPAPAFFFHMNRIWNVQETGTIGNTTIKIPYTAGAEYLLIHSSDDFGTGTPTEVPMINDGNGSLYAVVNFTDGQYFTFGALKTAPGCVPAGLSLWLKPDLLTPGNLINGTGWNDDSGNGNNFTTVISDPEVIEGAKNFNNTVEFDGGDRLDLTSFTLGFTAGEVFTSFENISGTGHPFDFGGHSNHYFTQSNNQTYAGFGTTDVMGWDNDNGNIVNGHPGLTINYPPVFNNSRWLSYNIFAEAGNWGASQDGFLQAQTSTNVVSFADATSRIGYGGAHYLIGQTGDIILYNRVLTPTEREKVNTYLSLKYGTTLFHDYLLGDGTMVWDSSANSLHHNDIAGIVRDDCQGLYQKQAHSLNDDAVVAIGLTEINTTNEANTQTFAVDKTYMVWGNDDAGFGLQNTEIPAAFNVCPIRIAQEWKVEASSTQSNLALEFGGDSLLIFDLATNVSLFVKNGDSDFGTGTVELIEADSVSNRIAYFSGIELEDDDYFTIGWSQATPGGVAGGLNLWLRPDDMAIGNMTNGVGWEDVSGANHHFRTVVSDPEVVDGGKNFNNYVDFDAGDRLDLTSFTTGFTAGEVLTVLETRGNAGHIYDFGGSQDGHYRVDDIYETFGTSDRKGWRSSTGAIIDGSAVTVNHPPVFDPEIWGVYGVYAETNNWGARHDGFLKTENYTNTVNFSGATNRIGYGGNQYINGNVGDVILYNRVLTINERERVDSYLGLKYGNTLHHDYLSSSSIILWDSSALAAHHYDVTGIGLDTCSGLFQKQSRSENFDAVVSIGLDELAADNGANANNFDADETFLLWGNDDAGFRLQSTDLPASFNKCPTRVKQEWLVQETKAVDNLSLAIGGDSLYIYELASKVTLFVKNGDHDFSTGSVDQHLADSVSNGIAYFSGIDLDNNDYFTIGWSQPAPGGVISDIQLWLRPNDLPVGNMVNGVGWEDASGQENDFTVVTSDPAVIDAGKNFNNSIDFDGGDYLTKPSFTTGFTAGEVFTVLLSRTNGGHAYMLGGNSNGHYYVDDIYETFGTNDRVGWRSSTGAIIDGHPGLTINQPPVFDPEIWGAYNVYAETNNWGASHDGFLTAQTSTNVVNFTNANNRIGYGNANALNGVVGDVIMYDRVLTQPEREKINTYLAIMYGLTLHQDYISSVGTLLWDSSAMSLYHQGIAAVGVDSCSALNQKQSQTEDDDAILTIYNGSQASGLPNSNATNTASFTADQSFMFWGHNDSVSTFNVTYTPNSFTPAVGANFYHMERIWKVAETGSVGDVTLSIPSSTRGEYLLVHNTDDFSTGTPTEIPLIDDGLGNLYVVTNLTDGQFFTFGATQRTPGCVGNGLRVWYDADFGPDSIANGFVWKDQTFNYIDVSQTTDAREANYNTVADEEHNFHPFIEFDGGDMYESDLQVLQSATSDGSVFFIGTYTNFSGWDSPVDFDNDNPHLGRYSGTNEPAMYQGGSSPTTFRATTLNMELNKNHLQGFKWTGATNGGAEIRLDGNSESLATMDFTNIGYTQNFTVGGNNSAAEGINGTMSEIIVYEERLSPLETNKVETYLGIKYGIHLNHDFIAGDGTIVWDSSALAPYHHNVAGIGREDCGGLNQKQSKSINSDGVVAIANGSLASSNKLNTNTILEDKTYLIWGHDSASLGVQTIDMPTTNLMCETRLSREWKVQETGDLNSLTIRFGGGEYDVPLLATEVTIFIDTDGNGDFTDGSPTQIEADSVANGYAYFSGIDLNNNDVFTFGWSQPAPGNVKANLTLWLRADDILPGDLVNNTGWSDVSGNSNHFRTVASTPTAIDGFANFNDYVHFDAADNVRREHLTRNYTESEIFSVLKSNSYTADGHGFTFGGNSNNHYAYNANGGIYENFGTDDRIGWNTLNGAIIDAHPNLTIDASKTFPLIDWNVYNVKAANNDWGAFINGFLQASTDDNTVNFNFDTYNYIGRGDASNWTGDESEVVLYDRVLTATERDKVNSYLGIKYGITLNHSYLAGDASTIWTYGNGYDNDIAGLGRDDCQGLYQKQSKSVNSDEIVTIYNDDQTGGLPVTNATNFSSIDDDESFMLWGNDDSLKTFTAEYPTNLSINRMVRIWKVEENGTVETVTIVVDEPNADIFLVDADGDFTDGNTIEIPITSGMVTYDFNDGDYFTFGQLTCNTVNTIACASSVAVHLTDYVSGYTAGGTWTETSGTGSGADISDPSSVDFSATALGTYSFEYRSGTNCGEVIVQRLSVAPAPTIPDVLVCEGGVTNLTIPQPASETVTLFDENFSSYRGYMIRSRCTGSDESTCYTDNSSNFATAGMKLDAGTDFSAWYSWWYSWIYGNGYIGFGRMRDQQISLTTNSTYSILPGEVVTFSGDSRRWWGTMEADDYVKFSYLVDGLETEFASRNGTISTSWQTSSATYTNNTAVPQLVEMRVKVKNSWNEGHLVDNFKIVKLLAPPTYTFYDDVALTTILATGLSYDPMTAAGTIDTVYVTSSENSCESTAEMVIIEVSPNVVTPMAGQSAFFCAGGGAIDLTALVSNYQAGGTWSDDASSGVNLADPTAVDVSALADSSYNFTYTLNGISPCNGESAVVTVNVGLQPGAPDIEDILICEGGSTEISVPIDADVEEVLYTQGFNGHQGYIIRSRCTGSDPSTCYNYFPAKFANRGLTLEEDSTDFTNLYSWWYSWVHDYTNLRFGRLRDEQIVLSTDSFNLLDGEVANFSGQSARWWGTMEPDDYVKFFYVIDGVETEFASRNGTISTSLQTSTFAYENTTGLPVNVQLRVKVKNSWNEGHYIDNLKITKTLNKPTYNFYSDFSLSTLESTGNTYDPMTAAGTTETYYVTRLENGCESIADTVVVTVSPNNVTPMAGESAFYCPGGGTIDLTAHISNYQAGGTWSDDDTTGVSLADPTAVDVSSLADSSYNFTYTLNGVAPCNGEAAVVTINIGLQPETPVVADILICEGGSTEISVPIDPDVEEVLYTQGFNGHQGYIIRSRCTGSDPSTCYNYFSAKFDNRGLTLEEDSTDFTNLYSWWYSWVHDHTNLRFARLRDEQIVLSTDSFNLLDGEVANFSGQSARWWGTMEADDYVKFYYVIDGVETEFASRNGTISTSLQTSTFAYENTTGSPVNVQLRVKVKNSWNEAHYIDNLKITKTLNKPTYNFYSDFGLATLEATGNTYDPMTAAGTTETYYVTRLENGCESIADTVVVTVSPNNVTPMAGESAFYCAGGGTVDLTAHISNYQAGGTWSDDDTTGVSLADPTAVDVSALTDSSYNFTYTLNGVVPCNGEAAVVTINVGLQPGAPVIDDIIICEGGSTVIAVQDPDDVQEELYNQPFNGSNGGYILLSRCTDSTAASCRIDDIADMSNRGLTLEDSTDFSSFTTWSTHIYDVNQVHFAHLIDEKIVLSTDSFTILAGEVANFSGDSRRYYGTLEADDYVKFFYVIDGVETEFDSREGNISTAYSTSAGFYENTTGSPVNVQLRVKVKNSYREGHMIDNLKVTKTLNKPLYNFYSDASLTTLEATGYTYDPATAANTTETYYVTCLANGCESLADTVVVTVDTTNLVPMDGDDIFYCGGSSTDLTALITPFQAGGVFTDIDASGVNLSDSSDVDFSSTADGSYNFSYKVAGSCGVEEALITVHIGILGGEPYVVLDGTVATAITECTDGTWIYFIDPNDENRRIVAINTNGNSISPSAFSVMVDVDAPLANLERASGTGATGKAVELMRRQVQINCPTCGTLSPAVDVRLYWESSEKTTAGTNMDALMAANSITGTKSWEWFKVPQNVAGIPGNFTSDGIIVNSGNSSTWSVADASGTEANGVEYVQFNGITSFSTFGGGWSVNQPDGSVLPVELLDFKATAIDNEYVQLDWATATEINNEGFDIQRSLDGINFNSIGWAPGNGNSNGIIEYRYDDKEVSPNVYYYRLRQVDFDGNFEYSEVDFAEITGVNGEVLSVDLIPNPSKGFGEVSIYSSKEETARIQIFDNLGAIIIDSKVNLEIGTNLFDYSRNQYSMGIYNVVVTWESKETESIKWSILK